MEILIKIRKVIGSMGFAVGLLVILASFCALGSFIPQGETYAQYAEMYSDMAAGWIMALGLDDVYHSPWIIAMAAFLCISLLTCNLVRVPALVRRFRKAGEAPAAGENGEISAEISDGETVRAKMRALGILRIQSGKTAEGSECLYGVKGRAGIWGAWVCHLGILLLILGFGLGQIFQEVYTVYGVPGDDLRVGDTKYVVTIENFTIDKREDDTVDQYTAEITVRNVETGESEHGTTSVNAPARLLGMTYYQNSTGFAADVTVTRDGEPLQEETLCAGDFLPVADKEELVIGLMAFYPDLVMTDQGPTTASSEMNNPGYLYIVYYRGEVLGMNVIGGNEPLTIDEYTVTFHDPQNYTLLQVKRDPFTWLALLGGLVTMAGIILAFYVQMTRVWAVRDGERGIWIVRGSCPKGGVLFRERFEEVMKRDE